jgi:uncharacterized damage-inducible protein DinB
MGNPKISRRHFVGTTALGIGCLAAGPASRLFASDSSTMVPTLKNVWKQAKEYTMDFAKAMPDENYGFKPTEEVFSFAEQLLHLAGGNYWFFASIKGEKSPLPEEAFNPEGKSKEDVIKLMEESFAFGDAVVDGLTDKIVHEEVAMGKNKLFVWKILMFCVDHITHHRGQMVVYLRLNGIKPPQYRSGFFG